MAGVARWFDYFDRRTRSRAGEVLYYRAGEIVARGHVSNIGVYRGASSARFAVAMTAPREERGRAVDGLAAGLLALDEIVCPAIGTKESR